MQSVENLNEVRPRAWLFLALCIGFQTTSVMLGKVAALRLAKPTPAAFLTNPWYLGGLACLVLQAFVWQLVLREVRLFVAYLAMSVNYFLVLAGSRIVFLERVTALNVIGVAVIIAGVYLVIREDLP
jgi:drug/metabolite transporter (DMT)-like permease